MSVSKAQIKATTKFNAKKYDVISIRIPKGKRAEYQEQAFQQGYSSFSKFITDAIDEKVERRNNNGIN